MTLISLHDRDTIELVLRENTPLNIYSVGDLDDFFWPYTTWYALEDRGRILAIALVYGASNPPTLIALAEPRIDHLRALLSEAKRLLPSSVYAHLSPGCLDALQPFASAASKGPHWKMVLDKFVCDVTGIDAVDRLSIADLAELYTLYSEAYPGNFFDERMLQTGYYFGRRVGPQIVCVAGVHVFSRRYRVAAIGNIVTHPSFRGQGHATAVTARLCSELLSEVDCIGLNVSAANKPAIACYQHLGFRKIGEYEEVSIVC